MDKWLPDFIKQSPAYEIFSWLPATLLSGNDWPSFNDYNSLSIIRNNSISNIEGKAIKFIQQKISSDDIAYEPKIYLSGEVKTRKNNWHDFFNMLIWCTFPKIKAMLNKFQYHEILKRGGHKLRSPLENFLTLFDENGLIIISSDKDLLKLVTEMQWKDFFWHQRHALKEKLRCYVFGHSLHEKLLNPYIGMVGHSILLCVDESFFNKDPSQQHEEIENIICSFDFASMTTKNLFPVPILGFPEWHHEASDPSFYDNVDYFRGKRQKGDSILMQGGTEVFL